MWIRSTLTGRIHAAGAVLQNGWYLPPCQRCSIPGEVVSEAEARESGRLCTECRAWLDGGEGRSA